MISNRPFFTQPSPVLPLQDLKRSDNLKTSPEPRMPGKHALNPPIVTVLGAGIAGLTAAHELVERGFLVQVVEGEEDPYCPGRALVGGMAANQPARVRANVEDLHQDLIDLATGETAAKDEREVAECLLELFAFNRRIWLTTEYPRPVRRILYTDPRESQKNVRKQADHQGPTDLTKFAETLVEDLKTARDQYRDQWLWDLAIRSVLVKDVVPVGREGQEALYDVAKQVFEELRALTDPWPLAKRIYEFGQFEHRRLAPDDERLHTIVATALAREFLAFRLLPRARSGFENAADSARALFAAWADVLSRELGGCCLSDPGERGDVAVEFVKPTQGPLLSTDVTEWLELDIIEQRLPGEHGFRFFPSFYRHVDDTMRRIPLFEGDRPTGRCVLDNLNPTISQGIGFNEGDQKELVERPDLLTPQNKDNRGGQVGWDNSDRQGEGCEPKQGRGTVVALERDLPRSVVGLRDRTDRLVKRLGGTPRDAVLLFAKLFRFMSTSPDRRRRLYEDVTWGDFLDVDEFSPAMKAQINSAAQVLVAFSVTEADARTYGNIAIQLLFDQLSGTNQTDRTLNGPTSDAWLEPWRAYLERQGVRFFCREVEHLKFVKGELVPEFKKLKPEEGSREYSQDGHTLLTHDEDNPGSRPDFYVLALNFEKTHQLVKGLGEHGRQKARDFSALLDFWGAVREGDGLKYMTGVQFFFDARTDVGSGHMYFPNSKWGLSSISQTEFWSQQGGFADGYFGVLSVGICKPGKNPEDPQKDEFWQVLEHGPSDLERLKDDPRARYYSVASEIFANIKSRIGTRDELDEPRCFHLDQKLTRTNGVLDVGGGPKFPGFARFLASLAKVEQKRPGRSQDVPCVGEREVEYSINHDRWVVCSTFMATHTRLTTMEAANESGRHAVRAILKKLGQDDGGEEKPPEKPITAYRHKGLMKNLSKKKYNGFRRLYDQPSIFDPEENELEDFDLFRRIDRRLLRMELPHFLDILNFDRKLKHALDAVDIFGTDEPVRKILGLLVAGIDSTLTSELGRDYEQRLESVRSTAGDLKSKVPADVFPELRDLLERLVSVGSLPPLAGMRGGRARNP